MVPEGPPVYLLLGDPVAHSRSPAIHNAALKALGLPGRYETLQTPPDRLGATVAGLRSRRIAGANVTVPHKEAVIEHLDGLTGAARAIGAVNTLFWDGPALKGDNTDAEGFTRPLLPFGDRLQGAEAVVLGAGGSARAVVHALGVGVGLGQIAVAARRIRQAEALAASASGTARVDPILFADAGPALQRATLIVNTTPVGMHPHDDATPWPDASVLRSGQIVYDLVYAPPRTRLLREAEARGATPIGGLEMLIGQAAASFQRWTGHPMPLDAVRAALAHA